MYVVWEIFRILLSFFNGKIFLHFFLASELMIDLIGMIGIAVWTTIGSFVQLIWLFFFVLSFVFPPQKCWYSSKIPNQLILLIFYFTFHPINGRRIYPFNKGLRIYEGGVPPHFWHVKNRYFYWWYKVETLQVVRLAFLV